MSMLYMTHTGWTSAVRGTIPLVNVRHHCDTHKASSFRVSAPQTGDGDAAPEMRKLGAFAFQGRCFVVARARGAYAAGSSPIEPSNALVASSEGRPFAGPSAGISSGRHHKAPSSSGRALTQLMGQCRGRTHVPMALYEPRRQRPCHRDRDEQALQTDTRLAHVKRAPGNIECDRSAGGSSQQYGTGRRHHREPRGSLFSNETKGRT
jgi:hypothetical protein